MEILNSCPFEEPIGKYEIENDKPQTNEEWRKTCSEEEFVEALTKVVLNIVSWNNDPKPSEVRNILKAWLKQPHTENKCTRPYEIELTNKEWLQTATTEQFAEWIVSEINERVKLALHDSELNDGDVDADFYMEDSDDWEMWLKQPHQ